MEFFNELKPTQTISINPPGGTGRPHHGHPSHLPPPTGEFPHVVPRFIRASQTGQTALWVVFALFTAGLVGVWIMSLRVERKARVFHWLSASVLTIAMVSYLAMATGFGIDMVPIKNTRADADTVILIRQVYIARFVDWLFTTPTLLISLGVLAGLSPGSILLTICADIFMIVTGMFSALKNSRYNTGETYKWVWYGLSCAGFLLIWFILGTSGMKAASLRPSKQKGLFYLLSLMTFILWTAYPIVFALAEVTNHITVDAEIIAYGVLDVAAKLGFTYMLLLVHTHGEDAIEFPEWFTEPRLGDSADGRTGYGAIRVNDD